MPSKNVTSAVTQLAPANSLRKLLILQNVSDTDVYVAPNPGVTPSGTPANDGLLLPARAGSVVPTLVINRDAIGATAVGSAWYAVLGVAGPKEVRVIEL